MTTQSPAWLDASYVQTVLRKAENDESIEVFDITVKPATAKGDNYTSDMYRVSANFSRIQDDRDSREQKCIIVKCVPEGELRQEMTESTGIFKTEISMLSETLPKMSEFLKNVTSNSLSAKCFHVQYKKPTHLVFEDLAPRGFRMANRRACLDLDHFLIAMRNLARFHAASVALKETDPKSVTAYYRALLHKDNPPKTVQLFETGVKTLAEEAVKWGLSSQITEKLSKLCMNFHKKGCEIAEYREDDFNVLNHGDVWINNMLFRYDEQQRPIDHIFVDFQISYYGAPAIDILYFFGTSASDEVRFQHRELILREYHDTLSSTMVKLKCNTRVPSFEEFQKSLKEKAFWEVVASVMVLPFVVLDEGIEIDVEEVLEQETYVSPAYSGTTYRNIMTKILPFYDDLGSLDV